MASRRNIHREIDCSALPKNNEPPGIGQVPRMRDVDVILSRKRRRRSGSRYRSGGKSSARSSRNRVMLAWSSLFGLMALLMMGVMASSWMESRKEAQVEKGMNKRRAAVESRPRVARVTPPTQDQAIKLVKRAMGVRDPEMVDSVFVHNEATAQEVTAFMQSLKELDGEVMKISWAGNMDKDDQQIEGVYVQLEGQGAPTLRLALLTPDAAGTWKVDFEAFARFCRPTWKTIESRNFETARVRVTISKYNYYNGPFREDAHWMCIAISSTDADRDRPEGSGILCGYCKVGSPQAKAMQRIFSGGSLVSEGAAQSRATIEIRPVGGAESRQFEITRVLAADWVVPTVPLDEQMQ